MSEFAKREEEILKFWKENKIFQKSVEQSMGRPFFSFYDGPPFLSGKPHYGHILTATIKDTVARYKTMKGFNVPRRVGWDCHGLPVENFIEKELNVKSKKEIEQKISIEKFNKACRDSVFSSLEIFQKTLKRVGRWADYTDSYMTLDNSYIESVWWVFKQLWERDLIYKDYRVSPYCPRCGTPLSNFEVNLGYKDVPDSSIYIKFKIKDQKNTYFLVWTTTPWTLTANVALATGNDIDYVKIKYNDDNLILAKEKLSVIDGEYKIIEEMKGKDLLDLEYKPLYNFIKPDKKSHFVVSGDFVSTEDGTGIVHIAPAFGAEDMQVGKENNLPVIITVDEEGKLKEEVEPWQGVFVKDADKEIIKDLKERNLLFKSETITHTYPFCWRCDTPLLYYPLDTWYIAVEKIKDQLIENNKKINWVPEHIKEGRFGKWLEGARDWAFTRNRYWGAPVPIWQCQKCGHKKIIGSVEELKGNLGNLNKLFLIRHAEAENNVSEILSSWPEKAEYHLTEKGKEQAKKMAEFLKKENIDLIFSSPVTRTKETAEIIAKKLDIEVIFNERLREIGYGDLEGKAYRDFERQYPRESRIEKTEHGIETGNQIKERLENFLEEINKKYKNKNIVVVSHGDPIQIFYGITQNLSLINSFQGWYPKKGSVKIVYSRLIDLHRPYIDEIVLDCEKCGDKMRRVEEVFDCWFESGAMPYAQYHYPFENKKFVEDTFPADFIAEGLDQTRGWFYTLHILSTALFNNQAFKNVVANGLILDSQGRKLSKKLRNYTEPEEIINQFGADALRFYLLSSTAIGEDYLFSDKGVQESMRKVVASFYNSLNFLKTYSGLGKIEKPKEINNILDRWILIRLQKTISDVTGNMDKYDLTRASRVFIDFFDDLTNWYIRRSRSRFQHPESDKDYKNAVNILHFVLLEISKLLAPFAPFVSEKIYQEIGGEKDSVHLENYPEIKKLSKEEKRILEEMVETREIISIALEKRSTSGFKVRQPLGVSITSSQIFTTEPYASLYRDEVNVERVIYDKDLKEKVKHDFTITEELKQKGIMRELVRNIQDLRKKAGLKPQDKIELIFETSKEGEEIIKKFESEIKKLTNTTSIKFSESDGEKIKIDELKFKIEIKI